MCQSRFKLKSQSTCSTIRRIEIVVCAPPSDTLPLVLNYNGSHQLIFLTLYTKSMRYGREIFFILLIIYSISHKYLIDLVVFFLLFFK